MQGFAIKELHEPVSGGGGAFFARVHASGFTGFLLRNLA